MKSTLLVLLGVAVLLVACWLGIVTFADQRAPARAVATGSNGSSRPQEVADDASSSPAPDRVEFARRATQRVSSGLLADHRGSPVPGCPYTVLGDQRVVLHEAVTGPGGEWSLPRVPASFTLEFQPFEGTWVRFAADLVEQDWHLNLPELAPVEVSVEPLPEGARWWLDATAVGDWVRGKGVPMGRWQYPAIRGARVELGMSSRAGSGGRPLFVHGLVGTPLEFHAYSPTVMVPERKKVASPGSRITFFADRWMRTVTVRILDREGRLADVSAVARFKGKRGHSRCTIRKGEGTMQRFSSARRTKRSKTSSGFPEDVAGEIVCHLETGETFHHRCDAASWAWPHAVFEFTIGEGVQPWTVVGDELEGVFRPVVVDREGATAELIAWVDIPFQDMGTHKYTAGKGLVLTIGDQWVQLWIMRDDGAVCHFDIEGRRDVALRPQWLGEVSKVDFRGIVEDFSLRDVSMQYKVKIPGGITLRTGVKDFTRESLLSSRVDLRMHPSHECYVGMSATNTETGKKGGWEFKVKRGVLGR